MPDEEKVKGVAICESCGQPSPVRIRPDGSVHPIGGRRRCCADSSYRVVENESPSEFANDD